MQALCFLNERIPNDKVLKRVVPPVSCLFAGTRFFFKKKDQGSEGRELNLSEGISGEYLSFNFLSAEMGGGCDWFH